MLLVGGTGSQWLMAPALQEVPCLQVEKSGRGGTGLRNVEKD